MTHRTTTIVAALALAFASTAHAQSRGVGGPNGSSAIGATAGPSSNIGTPGSLSSSTAPAAGLPGSMTSSQGALPGNATSMSSSQGAPAGTPGSLSSSQSLNNGTLGNGTIGNGALGSSLNSPSAGSSAFITADPSRDNDNRIVDPSRTVTITGPGQGAPMTR